MPSYYDESKNCRVGVMDEGQFYAEAGASSGAYFETLIRDWQDAGGTLKWGAGGVGLRSLIDGKAVGICFVAPAYAGKKDRIELSLTPLGKRIGAERCDALKSQLARAAGDRLKGKSMVSILEPGSLQAADRQALTSALCRML